MVFGETMLVKKRRGGRGDEDGLREVHRFICCVDNFIIRYYTNKTICKLKHECVLDRRINVEA